MSKACAFFFAASLLTASQLHGQEDFWATAFRAQRPSLAIEWSTGQTNKKTPAEVKKGTPVTLRVEPRSGASIRWFQIVPDTRRFYKNANHPWEANAYKWVGFGKIDCRRREIESWRDRWEVSPSSENAIPFAWPDAGRFYHDDVGSFWFEVEILHEGKIQRSPGLAESAERGMSPAVFRLSIREDDTLVGWLTSFFNVPGLFGCIPWQSENYVGVDCADALVAAWSKWKKRPMNKDWNVQGIVTGWPKVAEFNLTEGMPDREIRWDRDIQPGDFIAVQYTPGKQYQHIGALYGDANQNGLLDPEDQLIHCGPEALQVQSLKGRSFSGKLAVIRATNRD